MRIVRVLSNSHPSWGLLEGGEVRLLTRAPYGSSIEFAGESLPTADVAFLAPASPSKILAVGRNYAQHVAELGLPVAAEPAIFLKPPSCVVGPEDVVELPPRQLSTEVEHEAEVAVVIGTPLRNGSADEAAGAILGLTCANDVTARDLQRKDTHVTRSKSFDTFCPLGPWIESDLRARSDLEVLCRVNGATRQRARTSEMIHDIPELLCYISQFTTLLPGDVVLTGTPAGTGPIDAGDRVEIEIEGIGVLKHGVTRFASTRS